MSEINTIHEDAVCSVELIDGEAALRIRVGNIERMYPPEKWLDMALSRRAGVGVMGTKSTLSLIRAKRQKLAGWTITEIARDHDVSTRTIHRWLREAGVPGENQNSACPNAVRDSALAALKEGKTHSEAARIAGVSRSTIGRWARAGAYALGTITPQPVTPASAT